MGRLDRIAEGDAVARGSGARWILRNATRVEHDQVDAAFGAHDVTTLDGYGRFLVAQSGALIGVEQTIEAAGGAVLMSDWPARRRGDLLLEDLAELGLGPAEPVSPPDLATDAEVLGAAYVLEGSRLGGVVLSGQIPVTAPRRFLAADGTGPRWRALTELIDARLVDEAEIAAAVAAARAVFSCFHQAALRSASA